MIAIVAQTSGMWIDRTAGSGANGEFLARGGLR